MSDETTANGTPLQDQAAEATADAAQDAAQAAMEDAAAREAVDADAALRAVQEALAEGSGAAGAASEDADGEDDAEPITPVPVFATIDEAADRVVALESDLASTKQQLMRAVADIQNIRKRSERDRKDAETYGGTKLARDLLAVYDNLETALKQASDELQEKEPGFFNGVALTLKELTNAFAKHRIERVNPQIGEKFDPNLHQAMFEAPAPGAEPGAVIQVMQEGFTIADRLLRPALVGVAKADAASATESEASNEDASETVEEPTAAK